MQKYPELQLAQVGPQYVSVVQETHWPWLLHRFPLPAAPQSELTLHSTQPSVALHMGFVPVQGPQVGPHLVDESQTLQESVVESQYFPVGQSASEAHSPQAVPVALQCGLEAGHEAQLAPQNASVMHLVQTPSAEQYSPDPQFELVRH